MDTAISNPVAPLGFIDKLRVIVACAAAVILLSTVGWMVAEPPDPSLGVMLAAYWQKVLAVWPALLVLTAVAGVIGTVIAPRRLAEGGVFAAAIGLAGMALKGGSMQSVLGYMAAPDPGSRRALMATLAFDTLLWTATLTAAWMAVALVRRWLWADEELYYPLPGAPASTAPAPATAKPAAASGWPALVITGLIAVFFIWLTIARTPVATIARGQVYASIATGFYLGAMAARYFATVTRAHWYLLAVPAVALLGYLIGYLNSGMGWAEGSAYQPYISLATTPPHALVRPLPIEYLALGVAGTLAGFWSGEKVEHVVEQEKKS